MKPSRQAVLGALCFVSSFLLFEVELLIARVLSPRFGSSAAVWTTSLVFFQGVLLIGYLFGERVTRRIFRGEYRWTHVAVVLAPALCFPFRLPNLDLAPALAVLGALSVSVGLPCLALSTTTVVAHGWLTAGDPEAKEPYWLYGISNAGALAALLAYPLVIVHWTGLQLQTTAWYLSYGLFVALAAASVPPRRAASGPGPAAVGSMPWSRSAACFLFAAASNALLMAVTNAITLDASAPLLWIVPLVIYLLTLIACFGRRIPSWNAVIGATLAILVLAGGAGLALRSEHQQIANLIVHGALVAVGCLICHWNLARQRPAPEALGTYYLLVALGGFVGSLYIGLGAPILFARWGNPQPDYASVLVLLVAALLLRDWEPGAGGRKTWASVAGLGAAAGVAAWAAIALGRLDIYASRTFYGFYSVREEGPFRAFKHGNTIHGLESVQDSPGEPLAYYHRDSPIGRLLGAPHLHRKSVGLVGLGVGSLAAYSRPGERWEFIEIDPEVVHIARSFFRFLELARGDLRVTVADARLALEREATGAFDLLVMDAFSSDSIPLHLLTREALQTYLRTLAPGGILVFHISSHLLDLAPELARQADAFGLRAYELETEGDEALGRYASTWIAMARDEAGNRILSQEAGFSVYSPDRPLPRTWTDDRADVIEAFRR